MGLFGFKSKLYSVSSSSGIYTTSIIPNGKIIKNIGMIKVVVSDIYGEYKYEEGMAKDALMKEVLNLGGNAIINFNFECGSFQRGAPGVYLGYIIAYGDGVFIEYND